jgi:hypothetical protein
VAASATCNRTLHFSHWIRPGGSWHPEYLSAMHLPLVLEKVATGEALFARKFDEAKGAGPVLDVLDRLRAGDAFGGGKGWDWILPLLRDAELPAGLQANHTATAKATATGTCGGGSCSMGAAGGGALSGVQLLSRLDEARQEYDHAEMMAFVRYWEAKFAGQKEEKKEKGEEGQKKPRVREKREGSGGQGGPPLESSSTLLNIVQQPNS